MSLQKWECNIHTGRGDFFSAFLVVGVFLWKGGGEFDFLFVFVLYTDWVSVDTLFQRS